VKKNMEDCYRFLMNTYDAGDSVYLFGFSRGAFTARSLASMLNKCWLLHRSHEHLIVQMSQLYFSSESVSEVQLFKSMFCRECKPYFVGVWDTVGALGVLLSLRQFENNILSPDVYYAFHAVSIDEKRARFRPSLWNETDTSEGQV